MKRSTNRNKIKTQYHIELEFTVIIKKHPSILRHNAAMTDKKQEQKTGGRSGVAEEIMYSLKKKKDRKEL